MPPYLGDVFVADGVRELAGCTAGYDNGLVLHQVKTRGLVSHDQRSIRRHRDGRDNWKRSTATSRCIVDRDCGVHSIGAVHVGNYDLVDLVDLIGADTV